MERFENEIRRVRGARNGSGDLETVSKGTCKGLIGKTNERTKAKRVPNADDSMRSERGSCRSSPFPHHSHPQTQTCLSPLPGKICESRPLPRGAGVLARVGASERIRGCVGWRAHLRQISLEPPRRSPCPGNAYPASCARTSVAETGSRAAASPPRTSSTRTTPSTVTRSRSRLVISPSRRCYAGHPRPTQLST